MEELNECLWVLAKVDSQDHFSGLRTALGEVHRNSDCRVFYVSAEEAFNALDALWKKDPPTASETRVYELPVNEVYELRGPFEEGISRRDFV